MCDLGGGIIPGQVGPARSRIVRRGIRRDHDVVYSRVSPRKNPKAREARVIQTRSFAITYDLASTWLRHLRDASNLCQTLFCSPNAYTYVLIGMNRLKSVQ